MPSIVRPTPATPARAASTPMTTPRTAGARLADAGLIAGFLGLAFLLGAFPQKDFDLWFHLRTGQLVRQSWQLPHKDIYTYSVPDHPYIDLHWGFEVVSSWLFERGGMRTLNLAKCGVTCLGLLVLISARRRSWPVWAAVLAWLPALFLLGGRMYVRPETLTFLCLAVFLAVLSRWDRHPKLAFLLVPTQAVWVNVQGLFVLGPILLAMGLVDAAWGTIRDRGRDDAERRRWWKTVGIASALTIAACLANPYGLEGALFPIQLAGTMANPIFHKTIAELTPIPEFIARHGLSSLPLQIHLAVLALGALSFALPLAWSLLRPAEMALSKPKAPRADGEGKETKAKLKARKPAPRETVWKLSLFRLMLFAAFGGLSLQATRNSHQFATVAGTVTAWNFAEWAGAILARRERAKRPTSGFVPRLIAFLALAGCAAFVASGVFYRMAGEGRTVGLGEEPLWYPHEAAKFAGRDDMPKRMLGFHIGLPALYEYYHGPGRKVFADPRLEVMGADLYERYMDLSRDIASRQSGWERQLAEIEDPVILVDNAGNFGVGGTLLGSPRMRCVYFDPIASVFVPEDVAKAPAVNFLGRHFRPEAATTPAGLPALTMSAQSLWSLANALRADNRLIQARELVTLGLGHARRVSRGDPDSPTGWKLIGQLELARDPLSYRQASARYRMPFNPVIDLSAVRATYALLQALDRDPGAPGVVFSLADSFRGRDMLEAALPLLDQMAAMTPINPAQQQTVRLAEDLRASLRARLGPVQKVSDHPNASELDAAASRLLEGGRVALGGRPAGAVGADGAEVLGRGRSPGDAPPAPGTDGEGPGDLAGRRGAAAGRTAAGSGRGDVPCRGGFCCCPRVVSRGHRGGPRPVRGPVRPGRPGVRRGRCPRRAGRGREGAGRRPRDSGRVRRTGPRHDGPALCRKGTVRRGGLRGLRDSGGG